MLYHRHRLLSNPLMALLAIWKPSRIVFVFFLELQFAYHISRKACHWLLCRVTLVAEDKLKMFLHLCVAIFCWPVLMFCISVLALATCTKLRAKADKQKHFEKAPLPFSDCPSEFKKFLFAVDEAVLVPADPVSRTRVHSSKGIRPRGDGIWTYARKARHMLRNCLRD